MDSSATGGIHSTSKHATCGSGAKGGGWEGGEGGGDTGSHVAWDKVCVPRKWPFFPGENVSKFNAYRPFMGWLIACSEQFASYDLVVCTKQIVEVLTKVTIGA
jgi:hypothetical protein